MTDDFLGAIVRSFAVAGFLGSPSQVGIVIVDHDGRRHVWLFDKAGAKVFSEKLIAELSRHFTDIRQQLEHLDEETLGRFDAIATDYITHKPVADTSIVTGATRASYKKFSSFRAVRDGILIDITGLDDVTERFTILAHLGFKLAEDIRVAEQSI